MTDLVRDFRVALRSLRKSPGFAVVACLIPAVRATRVNPIEALRSE